MYFFYFWKVDKYFWKILLKDWKNYLEKKVCQSPSFFTLTWVKKCSQHFNFYQSLFKHEYLYIWVKEVRTFAIFAGNCAQSSNREAVTMPDSMTWVMG